MGQFSILLQRFGYISQDLTIYQDI